MRSIVLGVVVVLGVASTAYPQAAVDAFRVAQGNPPSADTGDRAIVLQAAPIVIAPEPGRTPLRVAAAGTTVELLGVEGNWVFVRFQDPQFGLRSGYIESRFVRIDRAAERPIDLSVPPPRVSQPAPPARGRAPQTVDPTAAPRPVAAQSDSETLADVRQGLWFNFGMGLGSACQGVTDCLRGLSGGLSVGATINPHVLFGVGTTGYYREIGLTTLTAGTLDARFRAYPWLKSGFYLTGGAGLGSVSADEETSFGFGTVFGIGWDIKVGRKASLTPFYDWFLIRGNGIEANIEQLGIGFTIH